MEMTSEKANAIGMMDEFLDMLTQSDEWARIMKDDPWIQKADAEKAIQLEKVNLTMGKKDCIELEAATLMYDCAIINAAILYGIHVADTIRTISASPMLVSQRIVDRMKKAEEKA